LGVLANEQAGERCETVPRSAVNSNRHHANWLHQMAQLTGLPPNQIDNIARQLGGLFELE
jgi:hypothetical protein